MDHLVESKALLAVRSVKWSTASAKTLSACSRTFDHRKEAPRHPRPNAFFTAALELTSGKLMLVLVRVMLLSNELNPSQIRFSPLS